MNPAPGRRPTKGSREWYESASPQEIEIYRRRCRTKSAVRRERDPDRERLKTKTYKASHPEVVFRQHARRRGSVDIGDDGSVDAVFIGRLLRRTKTCPYCGMPLSKETRQLDHRQPLSKGGKHVASNVLISCAICNLRKHAKTWMEWLATLELGRALTLVERYDNG